MYSLFNQKLTLPWEAEILFVGEYVSVPPCPPALVLVLLLAVPLQEYPVPSDPSIYVVAYVLFPLLYPPTTSLSS